MRSELQKKREMLLRRRDMNIERRHHLESLKTKQGITKSWIFTYYVKWPRDTYERSVPVYICDNVREGECFTYTEPCLEHVVMKLILHRKSFIFSSCCVNNCCFRRMGNKDDKKGKRSGKR